MVNCEGEEQDLCLEKLCDESVWGKLTAAFVITCNFVSDALVSGLFKGGGCWVGPDISWQFRTGWDGNINCKIFCW